FSCDVVPGDELPQVLGELQAAGLVAVHHVPGLVVLHPDPLGVVLARDRELGEHVLAGVERGGRVVVAVGDQYAGVRGLAQQTASEENSRRRRRSCLLVAVYEGASWSIDGAVSMRGELPSPAGAVKRPSIRPVTRPSSRSSSARKAMCSMRRSARSTQSGSTP